MNGSLARPDAWPTASVAVLALLASGCSMLRPGPAGEELPDDPDAITILVQNNLTPPIALTVYLVTDAGTSSRLGQVIGASTERFTTRVPPVGRAQLYARGSDGTERRSNTVSLRPGQFLEWDVFANIVSERFRDQPYSTAFAADSTFRLAEESS